MWLVNRVRGNQKGFTLIELVIIVVVLGILAAVAIPKYFDMVDDAKESACRGSLGGMRSALSIWYAKTALETGTASFPAIDSLRASGVVLATGVPKNPYQADANAPDSIVTGVTKGTIVGTRGGWAYKASSGEVWPNTSTVGENNY